jgi:hypothetical protein
VEPEVYRLEADVVCFRLDCREWAGLEELHVVGIEVHGRDVRRDLPMLGVHEQ